MHGLQAIAGIRQGAANDHAHRVIEIRAAHFVFKADGEGFFCEDFHDVFQMGYRLASDSDFGGTFGPVLSIPPSALF
jgi:hypothetical protein